MFLTALTLVFSLSAPAQATEGAAATQHQASAASDAAAEKKKAAAKKSGGNKSGDNGGKKNGKGKGKGQKAEKDPPGKIVAAEFENSARTLKKGTIVLSPLFMPSSYGISNKVQLLVPIAPQMLGPQLGVRYDFMNKKKKDLSVEPFASSDWQFSSVTAGANLRYTMEMQGKGRLNAAVGGSFGTTLDNVESVAQDGTSGLSTSDIPASGLAGLNVEVGYDYVQNEKTVWRFKGATDPYADANGAASALVAANWNHTMTQNFRLGLGLAVYVGSSQERAMLSKVGLDLSDHDVLPLPTVDLWWRM